MTSQNREAGAGAGHRSLRRPGWRSTLKLKAPCEWEISWVHSVQIAGTIPGRPHNGWLGLLCRRSEGTGGSPLEFAPRFKKARIREWTRLSSSRTSLSGGQTFLSSAVRGDDPRAFWVSQEHVPKKLNDFFDENMLQLDIWSDFSSLG